MAKPNNFFSTACAMIFVVFLPVGLLLITITIIFKHFTGSDFLSFLALIGFVTIFFGAIFFALHFIAKFFEGNTSTSNNVDGNDILDEDMM